MHSLANSWDPALRVQQLDDFGLTGAVVFPNYGLLWERSLSHDLEAVRVNMAAWNRYAAAVRYEGDGRLHPVGHVTLRDLDWLDHQLVNFESSSIRLAMVSPCLVDGKRLSHPDLERAWAGFADHGWRRSSTFPPSRRSALTMPGSRPIPNQ